MHVQQKRPRWGAGSVRERPAAKKTQATVPDGRLASAIDPLRATPADSGSKRYKETASSRSAPSLAQLQPAPAREGRTIEAPPILVNTDLAPKWRNLRLFRRRDGSRSESADAAPYFPPDWFPNSRNSRRSEPIPPPLPAWAPAELRARRPASKRAPPRSRDRGRPPPDAPGS